MGSCKCRIFALLSSSYFERINDDDELNDALLLKRGNDFWKCWNSKFSSGVGQCKQVDGFTDHQQIADNFEKLFVAIGSVVQSNANCNMQ